jgi:riboflavin kinase/FMN adenylyltransferase
MKIINSNHTFQLNDAMAATIGFFDGVHAGHRFLLAQLKTQAKVRELPSMVITFPQHPQSVLHSEFQPKLLNTFDERIERLSLSGIDYCLLLDFTPSLSRLSAKEFIQKKLKEEWHVKLLLIGYNHRFGKNRAEGFEDYVKYGEACGMEIMRALELPDIPVSSTRIRTCLFEKRIEEANRMLSYSYRLEGTVIEGNRLGRTIGFPTANLKINDKNKMIPGEGIYAVWVYWKLRKYGGMAYIGKRPTITAHGEPRIEVHLFDFSGDLYGETLQLDFVEFLREDKRFENVEDLQNQLFLDRETAIRVLFKQNRDVACNVSTINS